MSRKARFCFIEAYLEVFGFVGRRDLLCSSNATGTKTLAAYTELHPGMLEYSLNRKRFEPTELWTKQHLKTPAADYLTAYTTIFGEPYART